nr:hypothetical protein [Leptospira santarosai]
MPERSGEATRGKIKERLCGRRHKNVFSKGNNFRTNTNIRRFSQRMERNRQFKRSTERFGKTFPLSGRFSRIRTDSG